MLLLYANCNIYLQIKILNKIINAELIKKSLRFNFSNQFFSHILISCVNYYVSLSIAFVA